jgi:Tfp pilus assembly protein PilN
MPRRSETPAEREARDRVKQRYDAQLAAINDFFARESRIEALRADIATLETEQGAAAAKLAEVTSVAQAAEIIGWPQSRVREVTSGRRASASGAKGSSTAGSAEIGE